MQRLLIPIAIVFSLLNAGPAYARQETAQRPEDRPGIQRRIPQGKQNGASAFVRTELFFGTAKPEGAVTEEEFKAFIDAEVTRRFPDGLTIVKADGQFRGSDGVIIKEDSYVLILLYPLDTQKESSKRIDLIRRLYMDYHEQQSVLRVDNPFIVWVSF